MWYPSCLPSRSSSSLCLVRQRADDHRTARTHQIPIRRACQRSDSANCSFQNELVRCRKQIRQQARRGRLRGCRRGVRSGRVVVSSGGHVGGTMPTSLQETEAQACAAGAHDRPRRRRAIGGARGRVFPRLRGAAVDGVRFAPGLGLVQLKDPDLFDHREDTMPPYSTAPAGGIFP